MPFRVLGFKSPMRIFSKCFPNFITSTSLVPKVFGCVSFVHAHIHNRGKLDSRAINCIFVNDPSSPKISPDFVDTSELNLPKVNDPSSPKIFPHFVDLNLPIIVRKGTRTWKDCHHLIEISSPA